MCAHSRPGISPYEYFRNIYLHEDDEAAAGNAANAQHYSLGTRPYFKRRVA